MYEYIISGRNNNMQANYHSEAIAPSFLDNTSLIAYRFNFKLHRGQNWELFSLSYGTIAFPNQ
jgi:hypothetical protein